MMKDSDSELETQLTDDETRIRSGARDMLISVFGEMAGSEALTRALVAERTEQRDDAIMWIEVYRLICTAERQIADPEIVRI